MAASSPADAGLAPPSPMGAIDAGSGPSVDATYLVDTGTALDDGATRDAGDGASRTTPK